MAPPPVDNVRRAREARAWEMRSRGRSQLSIARELGLTQSGVSRLLARVERRELRRLSAAVERLKVVQSAQLDHIIEESLEAWHRSKTPKKRAASKTAVGGEGDGGDEVRTTEVVERDGDTGYLYSAMQALTHQRSLWGLDVMPALSESAVTVAELARDMFARGTAYEQRTGTTEAGPPGHPAGPDGTDPGGADPVPDGPEPVQRDHPLQGPLLEPPGGSM